MPTTARWMIYGATGFTGRLAAREAHRRGLRPILAGRNAAALHKLSTELGLDVRVLDLGDTAHLREALRDVDLVLHAAGPFVVTQPPMLAACLDSRTHYLDITGELPVFENLHAHARHAEQAGITAVSGVGFDVVPTDTVAARLAQAQPDAVRLRLAVHAAAISRGTAITAVDLLGRGGARRRHGLVESEPVARRTWPLTHDGRDFTAVSIPWGDVFTAYHSTGIPTVETYLALPPRTGAALHALRGGVGLLNVPGVRAVLRARASRTPGPSEAQLRDGFSVVWGEVTDRHGHTRTAKLVGPDAYTLTVHAALAAAERTLRGEAPTGAWTPTRAFGTDFAETLPGVTLTLDPDRD